MSEEKLIDIKGTIEQFVKPDEPERSQEEAIMKYEEETKIKKNNNQDDETETTEEEEHLKRVKQELLASLQRVEKLEKQIYGQKEFDEKSKLKVDKSTSGKSVHIEKEINLKEKAEQKEREE